MIERWIAALHSELDFTAEEIADITWLGLIRYRAASQGTAEPPPSVEQVEREPKPPPIEPTSADRSATPSSHADNIETKEQDTQQGIFPRQRQPHSPFSERTSTATTEGIPIRVINAPAVREPLKLMKALRPLMQQVPTRVNAGLDEMATAQKIADERIWMPVEKPRVEPWLDLALVVDESSSMLIWRRTVLELQRMLKHYGAFRDVRTWGLVIVAIASGIDKESTSQVYIRPEFGATTTQQALRRPEELIDPNGRRLVLVVTDCVAETWWQGTVLPALKVWAEHGPMAIVQMLPEWMWLRTALRQAIAVQLSGLEPGIANQRLSVWRSPLMEVINPTQTAEILTPVFTLEEDQVAIWSRMVVGRGTVCAPGVIFKTDLQPVLEQIEQRRQSRENVAPTPEQRVQRFKTASTPMARRLAGLVAATPVINLPVIRLIQETLLPESRQVHVAEVLLGGLLTQIAPPGTMTQPDEMQYGFLEPAMRSILLDGAPVPDTMQVLSNYVTRHLRRASLDAFIAELRAWMRGEGGAEGENLQPFAVVAAEVLKRRGGDYAAFVREVEQRFPSPAASSPELKILEFTTGQLVEAGTKTEFPPLQMQEVEVVTIALEPEAEPEPQELQRFEFEVATIERNTEPRPTGFLQNLFRRGQQRENQQAAWVIRKQRQQANRWIEPLGEDLQLEMVAIPAGTFLMGSPKNEPDRSDDEGPQHEVRVKAFYMARYPTTQAQWRFVAGLPQINRELDPDPSDFKGDKRPVEQVSWYEAVEFCERLSVHTGREYRLPTEAEWEYACRASPMPTSNLPGSGDVWRAGTTTPFHFGETITTDLANYRGTDWPEINASGSYGQEPKGEFRNETTPVDYFGIANAFGLSDMHGNVWEWCLDHWHRNYDGAPTDGSAWLTDNENADRIRRGGSWYYFPRACRSAVRYYNSPDNRSDVIGFRVVCSAPRILP